MLKAAPNYPNLRAGFQWDLPARLNMGVEVSDRLCETIPEAPAIIDVTAQGVETLSFDGLRRRSNRLAHALARLCAPGARVGVLLPQGIPCALGHIAAWKCGAISLPLFTLFGPDALAHRLTDSAASVVITNAAGAQMLAALRETLPALRHIISTEPTPAALDFDALCAAENDDFTPADTGPDDPALLIYTSGTTGQPKGALHGHRVLAGHLPGVEMSHDFLPQPGDRLWTPADWAWIGGLLDVLMPGLYHGVPVVAHRFAKFDGHAAFDFIEAHGIRNAFLPPTALKMMRQAKGRQVAMRSVASGGETLGAELLDWGRAAFGVTINEFYGQTECNMVVSSCRALEAPEPGVMGWPVPGHEVAVIDDAGAPLGPDIEGDIAVASPDPVMFLRYWNNESATRAKFRTDINGQRWLLTGDRGWTTRTGRIAYKGREDDVISSSGYRIGPSEIEDCLLTHEAVALAGVVGLPDSMRGQIVAAFIQLKEGVAPSEVLEKEITDHVRARLAAHEAPRRVVFVAAMPMTTTGKIIRADLRILA